MKINMDFYNGKDEYSDGDIEDVIIDYIKKYPNDYEKAFEENSSWPVVYHLSNVRKNVVSWYPFEKNSTILEVGAGMGAITSELCDKCKKVTSIELSKRRASAIEARNKNRDNLKLIIGNFKDIKLTEKYDYILLNGVLEYGALYMDSDNPYVDFINKLKTNLKPTGKILVAIENKFGLKYWCGANEDHTGKAFDGIRGYSDNSKVRTFSKNELESLAKECDLETNFYYLFPDYKFPEIVFTDESLNDNVYCDYTPYYCSSMKLVCDEKKVFKSVYEDKMIPFFANSYFVELSSNKLTTDIEFVKFNNYRKEKYNLCTYLKNDKFFKREMSDKSNSHIKTIKEVCKKLQDKKINILNVFDSENEIYSLKNDSISLSKQLYISYVNNDITSIIKQFEELHNFLLEALGNKVNYKNKNIFDKYDIKISQKKLENLTFYENGFLDIIPSNILIDNGKLLLIDQEWFEKNVPIEYILFRAIRNFFASYNNSSELVEKLYKHFNLKTYEKEFVKLDDQYLKEIRCNSYYNYCEYYNNYNIIDFNEKIEELEKSNKVLEEQNVVLATELAKVQQELAKVQQELINIYNSKGYKALNKIYKLKSNIKK